MYFVYFFQRAEIVSGKYEPSEEECKWALDDEESEGGCCAAGECPAKKGKKACNV